MKKKFLALLIAIVSVAAVISFAGCYENSRPTGDSGKVDHDYSICYAFTATSDVMTINDKSSVKDYMDALKAGNMLEFDGSNGDYGYYITSVLGVGSKTVSSTSNSYSGYDWALYTSITVIDGTAYSYDDQPFVYNGVTLYKATNGVSYIPCVEGESYALVYEFSSMIW